MPRPLRDRLLTAAQHLEEAGHPDEAADVRAVLAPGGWTLLRAKDTAETGKVERTNMPLTISRSLRDQLKDKAEEFNVTLSKVVEDGFRKVLAGEWLPPKLAPTSDKVVLNVRVDDSLRKEIDAIRARLTAEAGYRVTQSSIAIAWMAEDLGVDVATVDTDPAE